MAIVCADCMKPRDRSVNFSKSIPYLLLLSVTPLAHPAQACPGREPHVTNGQHPTAVQDPPEKFRRPPERAPDATPANSLTGTGSTATRTRNPKAGAVKDVR